MTAPARPISVRLQPEGVPEVQAAIRGVQAAARDAANATRASSRAGFEAAAESTRDKWALAGREISKTFADFGRTGQVAGRELKQIAILGGEMAMTFGPAGPIASAVGLLTLGIVSMFVKARNEQKATQEQFIRGLSEMGAAADYAGLQSQAGKLWRGTLNVKTGKFEGGAGDLLARQNNLRQTSGFDLGGPGRMKGFLAEKVTSPLDGKEITVEELLAQYASTVSVMQMPLQALPGPRKAITTTFSASAGSGAAKADYERRMLLNGYGISGKAGPRLLTGADKAMFAGAEARGLGGMNTDVTSGLLPSSEQLAAELATTFEGIGPHITDVLEKTKGAFTPIGATIAETIGSSLREGLQNAFTTLFSGGGITQSIRQLTQSILKGLGNLFAEIATKAIMMSSLMQGFLKSIASMNPWAAGAIAVALLVASQALGGAARGAVANGGSAYSASAAASSGSGDSLTRLLWGQDSTTMAAGLTPRSATNVTVIGPNDPSAQRAIQELIKNANRRG